MDRKSEILLNGFCKEFDLNPDEVISMTYTNVWQPAGPEVEVEFRDGSFSWCMPGPRIFPDLSERAPVEVRRDYPQLYRRPRVRSTIRQGFFSRIGRAVFERRRNSA